MRSVTRSPAAAVAGGVAPSARRIITPVKSASVGLVLLDVLGSAGYPIGLLKELGELVRLHLLKAHQDELR
jgi:hypothetical protein